MIAIGSSVPIDRRRQGKRARFDHGEPVRCLSLAPLAGVMLVAVTLVSLSFPAKIHALTFDLYGDEFYGDYVDYVDPPPSISLTSNAADEMFWNGQPVDNAELTNLLSNMMTQPVEPFFAFSPHDEASYGATAKLLNLLKASGLRQFCITGLERNRHFEIWTGAANGDASAGSAEDCDVWTAPAPAKVNF